MHRWLLAYNCRVISLSRATSPCILTCHLIVKLSVGHKIILNQNIMTTSEISNSGDISCPSDSSKQENTHITMLPGECQRKHAPVKII